MIFITNKDKNRAGLASAIGYFGKNGYTVSIPLNDTQDYDILVDNGTKILKISVKATSQRSKYNISKVNVRNMGGTKGTVYGREKYKNIDYIFVINELEEKWLIPKDKITLNIIHLGVKYNKYKII